VLDEAGQDMRALHWVSGEQTARAGIRLYHYSLLLPKQVLEKCNYYANAPWARRGGALEWANNAWLSLHRPFRVHNVYDHPSWLERYRGTHPPEVVRMVDELRARGGPGALRRTDDIERLLDSPWYRLGRAWLKARLAVDLPVTALEQASKQTLDLGRRAVRGVRRRVRRLLRRLRPAR
jgi:hypothetical protein